jgi:N-acetylglucosaminyldiphosphoundecaprenol N-acetyl-beta-D-mannosaminyltransferase
MITPNVDQVVKLSRKENASLKTALSRAQWILPDGNPIVKLSRWKYPNNGLEARLTGSDFFPIIWKELLKRKEEAVLFVLPTEELGQRFQNERANTRFYAPPFFQINDEQDFSSVINQVIGHFNSSNPSYVFIGLGFPKQERIALALFEALQRDKKTLPKTFLLGASFEFYWGLKKRAPVIFQKLGIEFVHRLFSEPRRMFKRYLIDDVAFLPLSIREMTKKKASKRS